jgi:hypothetical protein
VQVFRRLAVLADVSARSISAASRVLLVIDHDVAMESRCGRSRKPPQLIENLLDSPRRCADRWMLTAALTMLVVFRQLRPRTLPVLMAGFIVIWILYSLAGLIRERRLQC